MTIETTPVNRRGFIGGAIGAVAAGTVASSLGALGARAASDPASIRRKPKASDYGPLSPVRDEATGLPLLLLPKGFEYISYGWTGDPMANGAPTPSAHDGMAAFRRGRVVHLVRNHERGNGTPFADPDFGVRPDRVGWHDQPGVRSPRRRVAGVVPEPQRHDPQLLRRADAVGFVADVRGDDPGQRARHGRRGASRVRVRRARRRHERRRAAHPTGALLPRGALHRPGVRDRLPHRGRHAERLLPLRAPSPRRPDRGPPADDGDRRRGRRLRRADRRVVGGQRLGRHRRARTPARARPRPSPRGRRRAAPRSRGARARGSATAGRTSSRPAAARSARGRCSSTTRGATSSACCSRRPPRPSSTPPTT